MAVLEKHLYSPIVESLGQDPKKVLKNANDGENQILVKAILSGRIYFYRGEFKGGFNASISGALSKLGAVYNRRQRSYRILASELPFEIKDAIDEALVEFEKAVSIIDKRIQSIHAKDVASNIDLEGIYSEQIFLVDKNIEKQLESISISPKFTAEEREEIARVYNKNMELWIQEWVEDEIVTLRGVVEKNVKEGIRYDQIVSGIQKRFGVGKSKAKFLARQETNLLTTEINIQRFKQAGATKYIWRTVVGSPAHPVRPMHKALDGQVISYDNPPIVDASGRRAHAGMDFNCRCTQDPIIEF